MSTAISQRGKQYFFDVLVVGSGVAGLTYVLEVAKTNPSLNIALVTKSELQESNTYYAQGGIAAAKPDDIEQHISDTLVAGDALCYPPAVESILHEGIDCVQYLIENGIAFDRDEKHMFELGREAGHTARRIYHVGDQTGSAIVKGLLKRVLQHNNITHFENSMAVDLIIQSHLHQPGHFPEVVGAYVLEESQDVIHTMLAKAVVLATGGAGKVYRYTTNTRVATGDGVAMAYRAGARVEGMEFYQFHPTLLYHPKLNNFLISEVLRGEGAYLRSPVTGERFMARYAPSQMELATRDVVARAIFCEMEQHTYDYVHLDMTHCDQAFLKRRFPMIYEKLEQIGLDLARDLIPVVPAAHYMGGGVVTDREGHTDLKRLYVVGESAFTGLHGANRLASNSLLEGIFMGRHAARASQRELDMPLTLIHPVRDWDSTGVVDLRRASQITVHWRGLRGEMSAYAGIVRTEAGLRDQLKLIAVRREMVEEYYKKHKITRDLVELRNIILVAELIVKASLLRRESRGGHYREDSMHHPSQVERTMLA
jgi:L-aspartate oxidase